MFVLALIIAGLLVGPAIGVAVGLLVDRVLARDAEAAAGAAGVTVDGVTAGVTADGVTVDQAVSAGVADQVPAGPSSSTGPVHAPSAGSITPSCRRCRSPLSRLALAPVVRWAVPCPGCRTRLRPRGVAIDLVTAAVFGALAARFGADPVLVPYLGLGAVLVALSAVDLETHRLPDVVVWPSFGVGLFAVLVLSGHLDYAEGVYSALLGAVVFSGFLGAAHLVNEAGMGFGDVKLSLTLGLFVGWLQPSLVDTTRLVLTTILVALLGGGLVGLAHNLIRRRGRAEIPFGPALALATVAAVVASGALPGTVL